MRTAHGDSRKQRGGKHGRIGFGNDDVAAAQLQPKQQRRANREDRKIGRPCKQGGAPAADGGQADDADGAIGAMGRSRRIG